MGKNEYFRILVQQAVTNPLPFRYVLNDVWFASADTMMFIKHTVEKDFVMPLKANRKGASLMQLMQALHEWAAPGSVLACTVPYGDPANPHTQQIFDTFKRHSGAEVFLRDQATLSRLCQPWQISTFRPLAELLDMKDTFDEADHEGINFEMYGVILEHAGRP